MSIEVDTETAGLKLVDRLIDLLGDSVSASPPGNNNDQLPKGISLPATAMDWMTRQKDSTTDKWTLLVALLHHVKSLRVTLDPWPVTKRIRNAPDAEVTARMFCENLRQQPIVDLTLFPKLQILWLDRIPVEWVQGWSSACCVTLTCIRIASSCIYNLRILLLASSQTPAFPNLTHLKLSSCALHDKSGLKSRRQFDQPLPTIPSMSESLRSLDLSNNDFTTERAAMAGVRFLPYLQKLDLSHNRLTNLATLHTRLHNIRILNVCHNRLYDISGIDACRSLVTLRLAHNQLVDLEQTANRLAGLTRLQHLSLEGNPFETSETSYRLDVLNAFRERRFATLEASDFATLNLRSVQRLLPELDGTAASLQELKALRSRTFVPIRLIPAAVQLSARQSRRVVTAIADGVTIVGYQKCDRIQGDRSKPLFSPVDVVKYISSDGLNNDDDDDSTADVKRHPDVVPQNVVVETCSNQERKEWELAFQDNLGMRYVAEARLDADLSHAAEAKGTNERIVGKNEKRDKEKTIVSDHVGNFEANKIGLLSKGGEADAQDLANLSLSAIKPEEDDMKASGTTTVTTAESSHLASKQVVTPERSSGLKQFMDHSASSATPQGSRLQLQVTPFSDHHWQDDNMSLQSSLGTQFRNDEGLTKWEILRLAEDNSKFEGSYMYQKLLVHKHLELYFEQFVFAEPKQVSSDVWYETLCKHPKICVWPIDRKRRDEVTHTQQFTLIGDDREVLRRVWKETIVPCGKIALRRLTPKRSERYGFHGELLWTSSGTESMKPDVAVDARQTICCNTDRCFYIMIDHDTATSTSKPKVKKFPRPIPKKAVFRGAMWPHAMACHAFDTLERITIGFFFQRLTLEFRHKPSSEVFVYVLLTASKAATIDLFKEFQELATATKAAGFNSSPGSIEIDNDDPIVLDSVAGAVAPKVLGVILHYQIVRQRWRHGDRGSVRRVCILTDYGIYLMDEDYGGDGSSDCMPNSLGRPSNRFVDGAELSQVVEVQAAGDDPTAITIVLRLAALSKPHNWRLVCRTKDGAERLVDDVRKATLGQRRVLR